MRISDWSSDVCSSDLAIHPIYPAVTTHYDWQSYRDFGEGHLLTASGMNWFSDHYAADPADYRASPIDFPAEGLPPTLLVTASLDPLRDQGRAYAAKLIEAGVPTTRSEEHTSELQSLMRISYAVFCLKKKRQNE